MLTISKFTRLSEDDWLMLAGTELAQDMVTNAIVVSAINGRSQYIDSNDDEHIEDALNSILPQMRGIWYTATHYPAGRKFYFASPMDADRFIQHLAAKSGVLEPAQNA
jgi:hypothetical protein|tara:strand:+ start:655 stop:978 length:324 start_codon:yes stop_codon:yes gene_type:complete